MFAGRSLLYIYIVYKRHELEIHHVLYIYLEISVDGKVV